jgi:OOP family OmpA-OmpF porin
MKLILLLAITFSSMTCFGQDESKPNFNRWSIDGKIGLNNPVRNFTPGYNTPLFNIGTAGLGVRYMFNAYFGLRVGATFNRFQDNVATPNFATNHGRSELEGIINIGNSLNFYEWTNRIGLLGHAGVGFARLKDKGFPLNFLPLEKSNTDRTGVISFGLTPQIKLTPKLSLNFDATVVFQARTHYTYDFNSPTPPNSGGFNSHFFEGTIGLSYYLGKKESHADWTPSKSVNQSDLDALTAETEKMRQGMLDDDQDGVPNYLDQELATAPNTPVDSKGVTDLTKLDTDKDGIADAYDACPKEKGPFSTNGCPDSDGDGVADKDDKCPTVKGSIADNGCAPKVQSSVTNGGNIEVIVYFSTSSSALSSAEKEKLNAVAAVLKANPNQNVSLKGHADTGGEDNFNKNLSSNRATAAKNYLIKKGVNASRISTSSFGSAQPAESNSTVEGRSKNRRVEAEMM